MIRVPLLSEDNMDANQKKACQEIVSGPHAQVIGPYHAWLHSPELARRARQLSEFIRFQSSLPDRLKELAILVTGWHWRAEFEYYAHAQLARKAGLAESIISAIAKGNPPEFVQADEQIVYTLCRELLETRRVSEAVYQRAVEALGLPAVVEVVATAGYYCMVSLTLNAFQVPLPPGEPSPFSS